MNGLELTEKFPDHFACDCARLVLRTRPFVSPIINSVIPHFVIVLAVSIIESIRARSEKDAVYSRSAI